MSKFEWLSIREAMDSRFRSSRLAQEFMDGASNTRLIIDLGCGTGTNYRYLSRLRERGAPWLCIDYDGEVLQTASDQCTSKRVRFEKADLSTDLSAIPFGDDVSITASAFLDLTSENWLVRFAKLAARSPMLISMTVSGSPIWYPIDEFDAEISLCLKQHRQSDHGFGPAAGSLAAQFLATKLTSLDCSVSLEASDWLLDKQQMEVLSTLVKSVHRRASLTLPRDQIDRWAELRQQQARMGILKMEIPHLDLLSLPW